MRAQDRATYHQCTPMESERLTMKRFKHTTGVAGPDSPRPNDCFVRAIAIATNTPYNKVYEFTNRLLERGLPVMAKAAMAGQLGPVPQHALRQMTRSNPRVEDNGVNAVLADFFLTRILGATRHEASCLCEVPNEGTFTVTTRNHIFTVIDGVIHDAHEKGESSNERQIGCERITAYYEIPKGKRIT